MIQIYDLTYITILKEKGHLLTIWHQLLPVDSITFDWQKFNY